MTKKEKVLEDRVKFLEDVVGSILWAGLNIWGTQRPLDYDRLIIQNKRKSLAQRKVG